MLNKFKYTREQAEYEETDQKRDGSAGGNKCVFVEKCV